MQRYETMSEILLPPKSLQTWILKNSPHWESQLSRTQHRQTCYQMNYRLQPKNAYFYETYKLTVKKVENKTMY
jgi:hypothetical protein